MKLKFLTLMGLAAMLFVAGCAKELQAPAEDLGGELQTVTFTATMDNGTVTRAAVDGDGAAANVNRCIMEIYYDGSLFERKYAEVTNKKATFTTQMVANRTYKVAFWADCVAKVGDTPTAAELEVDQYYTTKTDTDNKGLQAIALKGSYAGNNDARDAFFSSADYEIAQAGSAFNATLKRPFAQINVITTDWDKVSTVASLKPDKVDVTIQSPLTKFNALTGEASADATVTSLNYNADLYTAPAPVQPVSTTEKTLSMDYLFASTDKAVIDIAWKAQKTDNSDVSHSFSNIPYQRNYRTNIKGNLLTTTGQWNVTVDPIWEGEYTKVIEVADIQTANSAIAANTSADVLDVVFKSEPNDAGTPGTDEGARAIVTTPVAQSATLSIDVQSSTKTLYVGDYESETNISSISSAAKTAVVNINVPTNSSIGTLVINAPTKSVYINGKQVSNVGTITNIDAITSQNTLIIVAGQTVNTLTMRQGGLEIHGTVNAVVIPEGHGTIVVRDCENLNEENVYNKLKDYIATGYFSEKGRTTEGLWDIFPAPCKIGTTYYASLEEAAEAATSGQTIEVLEDIDFTKKYAKDAGHVINFVDNVTLNLSGKTITSNNYSVVYQGNGLTVKNGTFVAANNGSYALFIGDEIATTGVTIEDVTCSAGGMNIYNTTAVIKDAASTAAPTASATNYYAVWADENNTVVNIQSGKFKHNGSNPVVAADENGTIQITGGVYSAQPEANYLTEGYIVVANTDAATKVEYPYLVKAGGNFLVNGAFYSTLAEAVAAVPDDGEQPTVIKVLADVDVQDVCYNIDNKNIKIDGNAHTITATKTEAGGCFIDIDSQSKVDVENLNIVASGYAYAVVYDNDNIGATGTLTDVSVTSYGIPIGACGQATTLTLNNVTSQHQGPKPAALADYTQCAVAAMGKATINVNGGEYISDTFGAYVFTSGGTINISNSTVTAPSAFKCDSYSTYPSTINVEGGTYSGKADVANNWGGSSGESNSIINLKDGTFNNFSYSTEQFLYEWTQYVRVDITGGTYDANPSQCVVEGYEVNAQGTTPQTWKVIKVPTYPEAPTLPCVKIGDVWWAPVNCGYDATNYPYGKLYQWGRKYGCGYDNTWTDISSQSVSAETVIQSTEQGPISAENENASYFYISNGNDWLSTQNNYRWNSATGDNGPDKTTQVTPIKTDNDPCPSGWHVPTYYELDALKGTKMSTAFDTGDGTIKGYWFGADDSNKVFLPAAGLRGSSSGDASDRGSVGYYWSSSVMYMFGWYLRFDSNNSNIGVGSRANGCSVRCVQE